MFFVMFYLPIFAQAASQPLTLTVNPSGSGTIVRTPSANSYNSGTKVTLTATPTAGNTFIGWTGGGCGGTKACTITMNSPIIITANFAATYALTTKSTPSGRGSITTVPSGTSFVKGTLVKLTAVATGGNFFTGWSGSGCVGTGVCTITIASNTTVTANFTATPLLTSITGDSDGLGLENGRWTGQPDFGRLKPKSNAYVGFLAIESQQGSAKPKSGSRLTLNGKNFGTKKGSVQFLDNALNVISAPDMTDPRRELSLTIESWTDTKVIINVLSRYTFQYIKNGWVRISIDENPPPQSYPGSAMLSVPGFSGMIQSRGFGQCTWFVAKSRLDANRTIPVSAYATTSSIIATYEPQMYDALSYKTHVGIISSSPKRTLNDGGTTIWTFKVSEMNAATDEAITTSPQTFVVRLGAIVTDIGSKAGDKFKATGYWR